MICDVTASPRASPCAIIEDAQHCCLQVILRVVIQRSKGRVYHAFAAPTRSLEHASGASWRRLPRRFLRSSNRKTLHTIQTQEGSESSGQIGATAVHDALGITLIAKSKLAERFARMV